LPGAFANSAYVLLSSTKRLPGKGDLDSRKLLGWIAAARTLARQYGREGVGDSLIEQLLAHSPSGKDGVWPAEAVRDVLEDVGTTEIAHGMQVCRFNARGVVWRGDGGEQERGLAEHYQTWSCKVAARHPFTARMLADIASDYGRQAQWDDNRSAISKRLRV
jgi:hypothetical protein